MTISWVTWFLVAVLVFQVIVSASTLMNGLSQLAKSNNLMERLVSVLEVTLSFAVFYFVVEMLKGVIG